MSKYKILWIDDKWEDLDSFKDVCELPENDFEMITCTNAEEGMEIFEKHLEEWSGIILDAKVFKGKGDEVDRLTGLSYSLDRISELKHKRFVPTYIFTGQPDLASGTTFAEQHEDKYYEKDKDEERLIADIKKNADNLMETQLIHKYQVVFDNWSESKHELLRILQVIENEDWQNNAVLNDVRKVFDDVMIRLYNCGYCAVKHTGSNLADCSRDLGQGYMRGFIPIFIQRSIHTCVEVTNPGSHRTDTDRFVKSGEAPYLLRSLIYDMLNVLHWCKDLPPSENKDNTLQQVLQAKVNYEQQKQQRLQQSTSQTQIP